MSASSAEKLQPDLWTLSKNMVYQNINFVKEKKFKIKHSLHLKKQLNQSFLSFDWFLSFLIHIGLLHPLTLLLFFLRLRNYYFEVFYFKRILYK